MSQPCRLRQGLFDRWYIFYPSSEPRAWSGSRWVPANPNGIPTGQFQVCNFSTEEEAREYCREHGLVPQ
jgi:hypothetical protein